MRYISRAGVQPDQAWRDKADALIEEMRDAADTKARGAIIDANPAVWGELKDWLLGLSHEKCWFTEAKDCVSHWDVEHYRPKKTARDRDGTKHEGYWWLAFDWTNLRVCGNAPNRMKGTYFPLRDGCVRCAPFRDLRYEVPLLLDPADEEDPMLLSFDLEGNAIPAPHVKDVWEKERVRYTVERCKLDFPPLADKRKVTWAECWDRVQTYFNDLAAYQSDATNLIARDSAKQAAKNVRKMVQGDQEFSAVARACLMSTGDSRLVDLLRTA